MPALYVFPDTNLLLHFQRIDQLNWRELTGADEIVLVLAPIVIRELERAKDQPQHRGARQRARDANTWLRELRRSGSTTLPNGAHLEIATKEPSTYFTDDLDPDIADDRLIASVRSYKAAGCETAVATDDTILLFKLDAHGVRAIELPEDLRRRNEPDPLERENAQLRQTVEAFTKRAPKLELSWIEGTSVGILRIARLELIGIDDPGEVRASLSHIHLKGEGGPYEKFSAIGRLSIPEDQIRRYNEKLDRYFADYGRYYEKYRAIFDEFRRSCELRLVFGNVGSGSATHALVTLKLPEGITALRRIHRPKFPDPPVPPERPGPFGLITSPTLDAGAVMRRLVSDQYREPIPPPDPRAPHIDIDARTATWQIAKLLHGQREKLFPIACSIDAVCRRFP